MSLPRSRRMGSERCPPAARWGGAAEAGEIVYPTAYCGLVRSSSALKAGPMAMPFSASEPAVAEIKSGTPTA